jgi:hypothetical protein
MVGAFLFEAVEATDWLQDGGRQMYRRAARLAVPSLPRGVLEAVVVFSL